MLTESQRIRRQNFLGASDLAKAITGRYGGLPALCAEKIHKVDRPVTREMERGNWNEARLLSVVERHIDQTLERETEAVDEEHWIIAHADGLWPKTAVVEAKTPIHERQDWSEPPDGVSEFSYWQVHAQMAAYRCSRAIIVADLGDVDNIYEIEANPDHIAFVRRYARHVWDTYIVPGRLPESNELDEPDLLPILKRVVRSRGIIEKPSKGLKDAMKWREDAAAAERTAKRMREVCEAAIHRAMIDADCDAIALGDGDVLHWQTRTRKGYTVEAGTYQTLSVVKREKLLVADKPRELENKGVEDGTDL